MLFLAVLWLTEMGCVICYSGQRPDADQLNCRLADRGRATRRDDGNRNDVATARTRRNASVLLRLGPIWAIFTPVSFARVLAVVDDLCAICSMQPIIAGPFLAELGPF